MDRHKGELICNPDEIVDTLAARYVEVSSTESYTLNFFARKNEVKDDFDFECEWYRTYNVSTTMRELHSAVPAAGDTAEGPGHTPYYMSTARCSYGYITRVS